MEFGRVLIVGGGPAGSSCARTLHRAGIDTILLDKENFPRNKVCGGWLTPSVFERLQINPAKYALEHTMQPITGFRTSLLGSNDVETDYCHTVSYGIRRLEFDDYLIRSCGARLHLGAPLKSIEPSPDGWIVNREIHAAIMVGAGGHFCPVARYLGARSSGERCVYAQEIEFEMNPEQLSSCSIQGNVPELFFCEDLLGYGWCFRKNNFLNVGLGRLDSHALPAHVAKFVSFLRAADKVTFNLPHTMHGHAYLIQTETREPIVGDRILLIGDAAGLAYSQSGEGILPAIESGILAAQAIIHAEGNYTKERLSDYTSWLLERFGKSRQDAATRLLHRLPQRMTKPLAKIAFGTHWFSRHILLDHWFLHAH